jgi:hypothetical protein
MREFYIRIISLILIKLCSSQTLNYSTVDNNSNSTNTNNVTVNSINTTTTSDKNDTSIY